LEIAPQDLPLEMAFKLADDVLRQGVSAISELLTETGLINVDFAHIRHVMSLGGGALMSLGTGEGENKAMKALDQALHHPLLEDIDISTASGIIANFSGGEDLTFTEVADTLTYLHQTAGADAEIIPGVISNSNLSDRVQVILIVTGLGALPIEQAIPGAERYITEYTEKLNEKQYSPEKTHDYQAEYERGALEPRRTYPNPQQRSVMVTADLDVPAFLRKRIGG